MPKVSKEYLKARREQIIKASTGCFTRKGFHKTTMQDICRASSLSPGAVYRYFRGKEEIIKAITDETLQRNVALMSPAKEKDDTVSAIEELADIFFSMLENPDECDTRLDIELWAEAMRNKKIMNALRRSLDHHLEILVEIVTNAQKKGQIDKSFDPKAVARVMISFFNGLTLQKGFDREVDIWSYVDVIKSMIRGLSRRPAREGGGR